MQTKREILRAHYGKMLRGAGSKIAIAAILLTSLMTPLSANALTFTDKSVSVSNSKATATGVTYDFTFKGVSTTTIRSIKFQICDSPLQQASCNQVAGAAGASLAGATFTAGSSTAPFSTNWTLGSGGTASTATSAYIIWATGSPLAVGTSYTVRIANVTNPTNVNTQYYARIYTYTNVDGSTGQTDFGGIALSTGTEMTVAGNVQESISFAVGATGTCGSITGTSVNIGTGADNVLSASSATAGNSVMCVNTNASKGYTISYISNQASSNGFTNGTYTFADVAGGSTFTAQTTGGNAGLSFFGMNVVANNGGSGGPTSGAAVVGQAPASYTGGYGTANTYAFAEGAMTPIITGVAGPSSNALFTVTYAAQAGTVTPTGAYQVKLNYLATGTF